MDRKGKNNPFWGRKHSKETLRKMSVPKIGEKNPAWKGDEVSYAPLHIWVRRYLKRPKKCPVCLKRKKLEVANKSGKYLRDLKDWKWICRRCHQKEDGRLDAFRYRDKRGQNNPMFGKKHTELAKKKQAEARKKYWENYAFKGGYK